MTDATRNVFRQALELDPDERAVLSAELLASLESSGDEIKRTWAAEIDRRSATAAIERGEDWRVVLNDTRTGRL
jgi:hypothetical protein